MKVKIFITGGTFDKEYNELTGQLYFTESHLPHMLKLGRSRVDASIQVLMLKDSLQMEENDRLLIAKFCRETAEEAIVVTHGTDTMVDTAKVLAANVPGKTIVMTGAMIPYRFKSSDGFFNLGSALAFAQSKPHGVYVAMNGKCFDYDNVRKNREKGEFETLHE